MLEFKNRELLEKYQYNTVALSNDLMDRMHHIQSLERQGQNSSSRICSNSGRSCTEVAILISRTRMEH